MEYRSLVVRRFYIELLNRPTVSDSEINLWVSSGMDVLTIAVQIASSLEFQSNG